MKRKRITLEDRTILLSKIKDLQKQGIPINKACEQVGLSKSNYYHWVKKNTRKRRSKNLPASIPGMIQNPKDSNHFILSNITSERNETQLQIVNKTVDLFRAQMLILNNLIGGSNE